MPFALEIRSHRNLAARRVLEREQMERDRDAALMLAFQAGDEAAFRSLFLRNARAMVSFCHHFVRNGARAEELAQDVFVKLYAARDRYRATARFSTFLYRIASNHCLNELRRGEYGARGAPDEAQPVDPDALPSATATPEDAARASALEDGVRRFLAALPEKQRAAFVLCRFEGLSYEEIADVLDTTVSAVKSLVHRATVAAADALEPFQREASKEMLP